MHFLRQAIAIGALVSACSANVEPSPIAPPVDWGPLAVQAGTSGHDARADGIIRIDVRCVFLERGTERTVLVWPASQVSWDPIGAAVMFVDRQGRIRQLTNGMPVGFGGGGASEAQGGRLEDRLARVDWVKRPDPECVAPSVWFVETWSNPT